MSTLLIGLLQVWASPPLVSQASANPAVVSVSDDPPISLPAAESVSTSVSLRATQVITPPAQCDVPAQLPFDADVEVVLAPWNNTANLRRVNQAQEADTLNVADWSCFDVVPLGTEYYAWIATEHSSGDTWVRGWYPYWSDCDIPGACGIIDIANLGSVPSSPVLLSRAPSEWSAFAHYGDEIRVYEGSWQTVPGTTGAGSDPVVVSKEPNHIALFYVQDDGTIMFTEWNGVWRQESIPLSMIGWKIYLPILLKSSSFLGKSLSPPVGVGAHPLLGGFRIPLSSSSVPVFSSKLAAASRGRDHLAVFGVDTDNQLWVREWTQLNEADWSDTRWVKLMEDVAIARPGAASRHTNHLGVVVKNTAGVSYYIEWSVQTGWKSPVALGTQTFASPLTLVTESMDRMTLWGVAADNDLYQNSWTEEAGWSGWTIVDHNVNTSQVVGAAVSRINDSMVSWNKLNGQCYRRHETNMERTMNSTGVSDPVKGLPRGQALVKVAGRTVWVSADKDSNGWFVTAYDVVSGTTGYLDLSHGSDSSAFTNRVSVAASDLDTDGDDEVVVATFRQNGTDLDISVLELSFTATTIEISIAVTEHETGLLDGDDVNVAIGDMDGDAVENEIVVGYQHGVQPILRLYRYSEQALSLVTSETLTWVYPINYDLEIAIGGLYGQFPGEQLTVMTVESLSLPDAMEVVRTYRLVGSTLTYIETFESHDLVLSTWDGDYMSALTTGDLDADGQEDIVYVVPSEDLNTIYAFYNLQVGSHLTATRDLDTTAVGWRSLAVGDLDRDGRAEIVMGSAGEAQSWTDVRVLDMTRARLVLSEDEFDYLHTSGMAMLTDGRYTVLLGDMDNDSFVADLVGCATFAEVQVLAVLNGVPRWYEDGVPIQENVGEYAISKSGGSGESYGQNGTWGGSLSVGFEHEFDTPILAIKLGEIRAAVTAEFMYNMGVSWDTFTSTTQTNGYAFWNDSLGMVIYSGEDHVCYYYDVYAPDAPANTSRMMACNPVGQAYHALKSLNDWHSPDWMATAGDSWVDVGHRSRDNVYTNDVSTYDSSLPIDPFMLKHTWDPATPIRVSGDSQGGMLRQWYIEEMIGGAQENSHGWDASVTVSAGATFADLTIDTSVTGGYGRDWTRSVNWEETLSLGGGVYNFTDTTRLCYDIIPFVYKAKARTQADTAYSYLELDYYVPWIGPCAYRAQTAAWPNAIQE
jgi:hypothetical protein